MIRRWRVEPDIEIETADGPVLAISRETLVVAVIDAVTMADRAGGGFSMWFDRYPTGLPGEMVTTGAIVEWRDRTDASPRPEKQTGQAQAPTTPDPEVALAGGYVPGEEDPHKEPLPEDDPTQYRGGELIDDIGDGLDENTLPEEDDTAVQEEAVR